MYITHSFFQQSELSFDIFKVVHHMLPHSSLPGTCCSFSTQPQVPEASLLQVFIISPKHLHQSWCQEDYDSVCPGPVGLGPWDLRIPAQQVESPEGPLVGSQPQVAELELGMKRLTLRSTNTKMGRSMLCLETWIHILKRCIKCISVSICKCVCLSLPPTSSISEVGRNDIEWEGHCHQKSPEIGLGLLQSPDAVSLQ